MKKNKTGYQGYLSVAFGTAITALVPGKKRYFSAVDSLQATAAGTAHTITLMNAIPQPGLAAPATATGDTSFTNRYGGGQPSVAAAAAAGQAVVTVTAAFVDAAGNAAVTNDWFAVECSDGTWFYGIATLSNSGLTLTFGSNLLVSVLQGARITYHALPTNTFHANAKLNVGASATTNYPAIYADDSTLLVSQMQHSPIIIYDNNITATGALNFALWSQSKV